MTQIRLGLPKGRMQDGVTEILRAAGISVKATARGYRPQLSLAGFEAKILKPQNIIGMLKAGSRDLGFAGADWVAELGIDAGPEPHRELVELLDTGLDRVRVVAAVPRHLLVDGKLPRHVDGRPLRIASELQNLTERWIRAKGLEATFVRTFGATEVFPPEDADCIVDIAQTGATLEANQLDVVDVLTESSTRLYASPDALRDPEKRERIDDFAMIVRSVLEARQRVTLEVNCPHERLAAIIEILPCMRHPTVAPLHGEDGYAIKVAVKRDQLATLIPRVKAAGGTDLIVSQATQIVP